jgi:multidrug efflux system outer membrane protein
MNSNQAFSPPARRGRPTNKCHATLNRAQRGRSYVWLQQAFDLPGRAEFKVTSHLLDRRGHPSSKEGKNAETPIHSHLLKPVPTVDQQFVGVGFSRGRARSALSTEACVKVRQFFGGVRGTLVALWIATVISAGCKVGPHYVRPPVDQPASFKSEHSDVAAPLIPPEWWRLYNDTELDQLIASAHASNQTLRQAVASVDQARALARVARSFLYPSISFNPIMTRERLSGTRASTITGEKVAQAATINDWLVPFELGYEIDAWGSIRRSLESATAQAAATDDTLAMVRLTVETDVAQFYYTLRSLDAQTEILTQTVASYREQVRLVSAQLRSGLISPIVLAQAEAQLESTVARQQDLVRSRADQEHALAILCGRSAPSFNVAQNPMYEASPPVVPAGLPVQLLGRRPDVAAAERNVAAANAQIGVATAAFYPTFNLATFAGYESANLSNLLNWQSATAAAITSSVAPIFQGGRLKANLEAAKALHRQAVAAYVNQVLVAYGDVEDALTDLHAFSDEIVSLRAAVKASQDYLHFAQVQYKYGLVDYLVVVIAEQTLLANQLSLAQAVYLNVGASIRLIKALGGGWENHP